MCVATFSKWTLVLGKICSTTSNICLNRHFSYNFDKNGKIFTLPYITFFLFLIDDRHDIHLFMGNEEAFIELFVLTYRASLNVSDLLLIIWWAFHSFIWSLIFIWFMNFFVNFLFFEFPGVKCISTFEIFLNRNNARVIFIFFKVL